jgi:hypothetical protein
LSDRRGSCRVRRAVRIFSPLISPRR